MPHGPHVRNVMRLSMRLSSATIRLSALWTSPRRLPPVVALLAALGVAAGVSGCNPLGNGQAATTADSQGVKVGVVPGIDNATLYLAKKRGYFSRAGIDVKIVDFTSVNAELHALSSGGVEVAAGDYGNLFAAQSALQ